MSSAPSPCHPPTTHRESLGVRSAVDHIRLIRAAVPNQLCSLDLTFRRLDAAGGVLTQGFFSAGVSPARIAGAVEFGSSERREIRKAQVIDAVHVATHGSSPKFQFLRAWRVRNYAPAAA